jgi:arylsulfatase/arylsulfatase A
MTDDQGYGDFGVTGNPVIETPNVDSLARRSAQMKTFYVSPVCAPTRASLMTGRYNQRTGVTDTWLGRAMMRPEEVTLAEVLQDAGYETGLFGKWHLGDNYPMRPMDQGFDRAVWHKGGGLAQPSDPPRNEGRYTNPILFRGDEAFKADGYVTDVLFDHALSFIEEHRDRPFFAYVSTNAPHSPYDDVPDSLEAYYQSKTDSLLALIPELPQDDKVRRKHADILAAIAAMITDIDQNVGRLMERLRALDLTRETLVLYMTDNGPSPGRYAGPFNGWKGSMQEAGVRVPLWLHWPGTLSPDQNPEVPTAHIDLMPTILEAVGVDKPSQRPLDGRSFWGVLTGTDAEWSRRSLVLQWHRGPPDPFHNFMVRRGPWKLVRNSGRGWDLPDDPPGFELYNIPEDPGESTNLIDARPELADSLKQVYRSWYEDVGGPRLRQKDPPVRIHVGMRHENPSVLTRQDWRGGRTWSTDLAGYWALHAASGTYDVTVRLPERSQPRSLTLTFGSVERTVEVPPGTASHTFDGLQVEGGDVRLHPVLEAPPDPDGAERVIVERTDL